MISDETLEFLREHDPRLWQELTRKPWTQPPHVAPAPRITQIDARRIVFVLFPQQGGGDDDDDVIEGDYKVIQ